MTILAQSEVAVNDGAQLLTSPDWLQIRAAIDAALSRPIAFHRVFASIAGGACPGLFLSQIFYWSQRTNNADGWFYKTGDEWHEETALTRSERETARKVLKRLGLLEEKKAGVPCRVFYRLNRDAFYNLLLQHAQKAEGVKVTNQNAGNEQISLLKTNKLAGAKPTNKPAALPQTKTESTQKTEQRQQQAADAAFVDVALLAELEAVNVSPKTAQTLATQNANECRRQLLFLPHRDGVRSRAATLVKAIRESWAPPEKWLQAQKAEESAKNERQAREAEAQRRQLEQQKRQTQEAAEGERTAHLDAEFENLDAQTQREIADQARNRMGILGRVGNAQGALMAMRRAIVSERIGSH